MEDQESYLKVQGVCVCARVCTCACVRVCVCVCMCGIWQCCIAHAY